MRARATSCTLSSTNLYDLGTTYLDLELLARAREPFERALPLARALGRPRWEAAVLQKLGEMLALSGDRREALASLKQALALYRRIGQRAGEAETLIDLGSSPACGGSRTWLPRT